MDIYVILYGFMAQDLPFDEVQNKLDWMGVGAVELSAGGALVAIEKQSSGDSLSIVVKSGKDTLSTMLEEQGVFWVVNTSPVLFGAPRMVYQIQRKQIEAQPINK